MGAQSHFLAGVAALAALSATASAQQSEAYDDIKEVRIQDFIGAVTIRTGGDGVAFQKTDGTNADYPFFAETRNGVLTLRSDKDPDDIRWYKQVKWRTDGAKAFDEFLKQYPAVEITVPQGTALAFDSVVTRLAADDTRGALKLRDGHVDGAVGDIAEGDIQIDGSGDLDVGDVAGMLNIAIHGSGDFFAAGAAELDASLHGSGDIDIGDIAGAVTASLHGSGDIEMGNIGGDISLSCHGSGDVSAADVAGGASLSTMGSGDMSLASVSGKTSVKIYGSGDIAISNGRAEDLKAQVNGSGDFEMRGVATNPDVVANGSGSIMIKDHDGPVRARGRGDIRISGVDYSEDD